MTTTHLERLLFAQGGQCFFCRKPLPKADASVEHLVASANGGHNSDDNCVACCKALNHLLGSRSIKEKLQVVLNQRGEFRCPGSVQSAAPKPAPKIKAPAVPGNAAVGPKAGAGQPDCIALVLTDLRKRGAARPRKVATLTSTIRSLIKQQQQLALSDVEITAVIGELQRQGKLVITDTNVAYKLA